MHTYLTAMYEFQTDQSQRKFQDMAATIANVEIADAEHFEAGAKRSDEAVFVVLIDLTNVPMANLNTVLKQLAGFDKRAKAPKSTSGAVVWTQQSLLVS